MGQGGHAGQMKGFIGLLKWMMKKIFHEILCNMRRYFKLFFPHLVIIFGGAVVAIIVANLGSISEGTTCLKSFEEFAYQRDQSSTPVRKIYPAEPWLEEFRLNVENSDTTIFYLIELIDPQNSQLWIRKFIPKQIDSPSESTYIIYNTITKERHEITPINEDGLSISSLYLTNEGEIFGKVYLTHSEAVELKSTPILAKFNREIQLFEPVSTLWPTLTLKTDIASIIVDENSVFWMISAGGVIHKYNPSENKPLVIAKWPNMNFPNGLIAAISPDGVIYFQDVHKRYFGESNEILFRFDTKSKILRQIPEPAQRWPDFGTMLIDESGKLWLGAVGYMQLASEQFTLTHPNPTGYFKHKGDISMALPGLFFQSSDGVLWFTEDNDMGGIGEGTAWYDPQRKTGCWFTTERAYIVEDAQHQLWLMVNNRLYRRDLIPPQ